MVSAQNEFRNEFRRRFHISVDDNEVSRGDNNTLLQRVCALLSTFPLKSQMMVLGRISAIASPLPSKLLWSYGVLNSG